MANSIFERLARMARAEFKTRTGKSKTDPADFTNFEPAEKSQSDFDSPVSQNPEMAGYYANLEIPYGSDAETVTKAWKKLLRRYHPDLHSAEPEKVKIANEIVQQLNKAHDALQKHLAK